MPIQPKSRFPNSFFVSATDAITSTANGAANATVITGMSITPGAGVYMLTFTAFVGYSASGVLVNTDIWIGGAAYGAGAFRRSTSPRDGNGTSLTNRSSISTSGIITVEEGQAVEMRWYSAGGTMYMENRALTLIRVG